MQYIYSELEHNEAIVSRKALADNNHKLDMYITISKKILALHFDDSTKVHHLNVFHVECYKEGLTQYLIDYWEKKLLTLKSIR